MGKSSAKTPPPSPAETMSAQISQQLFQSTDPLRNEMLALYGLPFGLEMVPGTPASNNQVWVNEPTNYWEGGEGGVQQILRKLVSQQTPATPATFRKTGTAFDPARNPIFKPLFDQAVLGQAGANKASREAILQSGATGGARDYLLSQAGMANAQAREGSELELRSNILNSLLQGGQQAAFGTPATSLQGLSSAGQMAAARQAAGLNAQSQSNAGKKNASMALGLGLAAFGIPALTGAGAAGAGATGAGMPFMGTSITPTAGSWYAPTAFF